MGKTNAKGNFRGSDDWLDKEPAPFVPINRNQLNQASLDCWGEEGETGIPKSKYGKEDHFVHFTLEGYAQDMRDQQTEIPTPEDELIAKEEEKDWQKAFVEAGVRLIEILGIGYIPSVALVVGIYLQERMDGVIKHYFKNLNDAVIKTAILAFCQTMQEYSPTIFSDELFLSFIEKAYREGVKESKSARVLSRYGNMFSSNAKAQLIANAQLERQFHPEKANGPTNELGWALFGEDKWNRILRAK
ncbi:MAG: hypothetical protein Q8N42_00580 [bacterium]|nr:hypothetical protein [bacterium]